VGKTVRRFTQQHCYSMQWTVSVCVSVSELLREVTVTDCLVSSSRRSVSQVPARRSRADRHHEWNWPTSSWPGQT